MRFAARFRLAFASLLFLVSTVGPGIEPSKSGWFQAVFSCSGAADWGVFGLGATAAWSAEPAWVVEPASVGLSGTFSQWQLLVWEGTAGQQREPGAGDLTHTVQYETSDASIVTVDGQGRLLARGNGQATVFVRKGAESREVTVTVTGFEAEPKVDYMLQVQPILSKAGCNLGACHATQHGQGGFKLSVFGFEPESDYNAMIRDRDQRRVDLLNPENSLLLQKPAMRVAHGGGLRLRAGSPDFQLLAAWIRGGAARPRTDAPRVKQLRVSPTKRVGQPGLTQQLRVEAEYSDGTVRDVTAWARYDSTDDGVLAVTDQGQVTAVGRGQAPIMVRFEGHAEIAMFVIPYRDGVKLTDWKSNNYVDELAAAKFEELGLVPSPVCDDTTFVRRAFLDCIGTLPSPEETTAFVASQDPQKRALLIDRLLGLTGDPNLDIYNDAYSAYWTLKWSDLIRNTSNKLGEQGMWALHNWIRDSFRRNQPFDQFVRELVTGKGSIYSNGPANYFRINASSTDLTESTSQIFLGVRLECAKCHHHPFEKYSQEDYYSFSAFFSRVGTKNSEEFGLFGREQVVLVQPTGDVRHPKTGQVMQPRPLAAEPIDHPLDRRIALANWLTAPNNPHFARSVVNRYVSYLLGRGLVEPVDDMRSTNPPTNPALMDALSREFVDSGFNLKQLIRTVMHSRLYQLSSQPTPENAGDERFYSHFRVKRLSAEALLDAVDRVTGTQTKFTNLPPGTRAIELPDAEYANYFLTTFAKPKRASVCECERSPDESLGQALHTLNGEILTNKIADKQGLIAKLLAEKREPTEVISQLYLAALCRQPTPAEVDNGVQYLSQSPSPDEFYQDLLWALMNTKQFLFVH